MLVQVYRSGAIQQRIIKGFVVEGEKVSEVLSDLSNSRRRFNGLELIYSTKKSPTAISIDTGMVWFHTVKAREKVLFQLHGAILELDEYLKSSNCTLLPNAVKVENKTWKTNLINDRHYLAIQNNVEKEVFCNLFRELSPYLIALNSRAGVSDTGIEKIGSRRLLESQNHFTSRYIATLSTKHLEKVKQNLRRYDGVSNIELLDINPLGDNSVPSSVEIRSNDGQSILASVRAQAILYQALYIFSKRKVRNGERIEYTPQRKIEKNRARAITQALNGKFELLRQYSKNKTDVKYTFANDEFLKLLNTLTKEFQILEVEYAEIAPIVLGLSLREMRLTGIRNENELYMVLSKQKTWSASNWLTEIRNLYINSNLLHDPITATNELRFVEEAAFIRRYWINKLKNIAIPIPPKFAKKENQTKKNGNNQKSSAKHAPTQKRNHRRYEETAQRLLQQLENNKEREFTYEYLNELHQATQQSYIHPIIRTLDRKEAQTVRKKLRPPMDFRFKLTTIENDWEEETVFEAITSMGKSPNGIVLLECTANENQAKKYRNWQREFIKKSPEGILTMVLTDIIFLDKKSNTKKIKLELLICPRIK